MEKRDLSDVFENLLNLDKKNLSTALSAVLFYDV